MHYYNFNIGDFIKDSAHLTLEEEAIYRRLIDLYYTTERPIPLDINTVSRSIRARGNEEAITQILQEFFTEVPNGFKQKRIEKELKKYKEKSHKATKSAKARWDKAPRDDKPDANAMRTECEGNANHKPITNNQEPLTKEIRTKGFVQPTHTDVSDCFKKLLPDTTAEQEADKFINHYESNGWKVGKNKMKDWKAAARGWLSRRGNYEKNTGHSNKQEFDFESTDWIKELQQ